MLSEMGNESEKQLLDIESLDAIAAYLRESLSTMDKVLSLMRDQNIQKLEVRQLPKGKRALEAMVHFTSLMNQSLVDHLLPTPRKQVKKYSEAGPTVSKVAEVNSEIEKRREAKKKRGEK